LTNIFTFSAHIPPFSGSGIQNNIKIVSAFFIEQKRRKIICLASFFSKMDAHRNASF